MIRNIGSNIYKLYIIKTAKWFSLIMPIIVLFFQDNDLSMTQIFTLKAVYSVGMLLFEIPSGYFGDVWGRKKTLIVGTILTTIGFSLYSFSFSFIGFLIAEVVLGIGQSFISGADSAMLYDSLKSQRRENEYLRYEGKVTSVGNFSEAIAGIIGGLLATISLRVPIVAQVFVSVAAIPAAFTLVEPLLGLEKRVASMKDIFKVVKYALVDYVKLRNFILFSSLIGTATLTYAWFIQPYLIEVHLPVVMFGIIWTLLNITVGTASFFAYKIKRDYSQKRITGILFLGISLGFILTSQFISIWALPILFIFYVLRGFATPILKDYMNVLISSDIRATIISLRNMFIRIMFALTAPFLGWATDNYSLKTGLFIAGFIFLFSGSILYYITFYSKEISRPS